MNENEIIMLSSDEENDTAGQTVTSSTSSKTKDTTDSNTVKHPVKRIDCIVNLDIVLNPKNDSCSVCQVVKKPKLNTSLIEVVDLGVDDKNDNSLTEFNDLSIKLQINNSASEEKEYSQAQFCQTTDKTENSANQETTNNVEDLKKENIGQIEEAVFPSTSSYNNDFFDEFVNLCVSLEDDENDKRRLMKKLRRKYAKADVKYTKSEEFKYLIISNKQRLTKNNFYFIAKEVVSELKFNKKRKVRMSNSSEEKKTSEMDTDDEDLNKKYQLMQRIKWVLNDLASKIKELEDEEVDFSDDDSSFIQLHKYRKRFSNICDALFRLTKQSVDDDKICFTESKYPAVNQCIEKWLNETKKFPDFLDILKLLETQSSSLGLSSKKDSLREIAVEIFQNVGMMLKRRRCCDFWDSFSHYLGSSVDPSLNNAELSRQLNKNFQEGIKKELEIINFYAQKQDREDIKPEEVLDEDADKSPKESDGEEDIEDSEEEEKENTEEEKKDSEEEKKDSEEEKKDSEEEKKDSEEEKDEVEIFPDETDKIETFNKKQSKNNFKNCKSLKWRCESGSPNNKNSESSENLGNRLEESSQPTKENYAVVNKLEPRRVPLIPIITKVESLQRKETPPEKKKKIEVYDLYSCQVNPQYDAFYKLDSIDEFFKNKTDIKKKKVFRDLTNVGSLMKVAGERKEHPVLFSQFPILHKSWKIRCNLDVNKFNNFKVQKCGSNQEEKSEKSVRRNSSNSNSKEYSDSDNKEESTYFSGSGNEENNGDEKDKKNFNINNNEKEDQNEEDEEEENEAEENLHSKTTTSPPKIKTTVSATTEVKALKEANSSLNQVDSGIMDVKEIKYIQTEHIEVKTAKEDIIEEEVSEKVKIIEKKNNDELNENIKHHIDCAVEDKKKSPTVKKKNEKKTENTAPDTRDKKDCLVIMDDEEEAIFIKQLNPIVEINTFKTPLIPRSSCESKHPPTQSYVESQKLYEVETIVQRMRQQNSNQSPSDEERVKRFLLNSPSSISITPPKKLQCKNPLSQEALQALETLKNLKGISATRVVKEKPESEDDVIVIGESSPKTRRPNPRYQLPSKQRRLDQNPTDTHTTKPSPTRLPASQLNQNQHLFNNCNNPPNGEKSHDSSSIKISNVWGALSLKVYESISNNNNNLVAALDSNSRQKRSKSGFSGNLAAAKKKKTGSQPVEYVVLD